MILLDNVTIGSDPELFIVNKATNKVVSAIPLIEGTKDEPTMIPELGEGYALQTDNVLAEFNIPVCRTKQEFVDSILKMQDFIRQYVQSINSNYDILCAASQTVPWSELRDLQAKAFGCMPDYNAYTNAPNPKPKDAAKHQLRSAGFHIHIGYDNPNTDTSIQLVKYLDYYLGLPSILRDPDTKRRSLYGKAGSFRLTKYGVEYRVLSSAMMKDRETLEWVFDSLGKAIGAYNRGISLPASKYIKCAIDNSYTELAKLLLF